MKKRLRILTFLLALSLIACSFVSCHAWLGWGKSESTGVETLPDAVRKSDLEYSLNEKDLDNFLKLLERCERMFLKQAGVERKMKEMLLEVDAQYEHLCTQGDLAYIYYCIHQTDPAMEEAYLFSSALLADAYEAYISMCKRIDASESRNREFFFRDWTEEMLESMRGYSSEHTALGKANDELLIAYRVLSKENFWDGAAEYYYQMIQNQNRIAVLNGFDNYWEYAYHRYERDYGARELEVLRANVKQFLLPLMEQIRRNYQIVESELSNEERLTIEHWEEQQLDRDSAVLEIEGYLQTYGEDAGGVMQSMFLAENSFFANAADSYSGAFTIYLGALQRPVCYFGPGYQDAFTVVHEMGHYYADCVNEDVSFQLDLAEVHSQGNEWMFLSYLNDVLKPEHARALFLRQLYHAISVVICATIVDDFEQRCYESKPVDVQQLNEIMDEVQAEYGGEDWLRAYITDMENYWRRVVLENPVYYISYAVSMLAALQIYGVAEEQSFERGQQVYLALVEVSEESGGFLAALSEAGLSSPMEPSVFEQIRRLAA